MVVTALTLFPVPLDRDAFHRDFESDLVPAYAELAGLVRWRVVVPVDADGPLPFHVAAELVFTDRVTLDTAFASAAGGELRRREDRVSTGGAPLRAVAIVHDGAPHEVVPPHHDP